MSVTATTTSEFTTAVESLRAVTTRREILLESLPAPARLAPHSFALSATVTVGDDEWGSGRLVLLHDPEGVEAWDGTLRIVVFATCILDGAMAGDPLLPEVAWSWLVDALQDAPHTALGGTVTATRSTRFGDITGPENADDLEIRASWTPRDANLTHHLDAYLALLAAAAGLPPEGVSPLRVNDRSNDY
ncbi:DUF3000 domain-containing protein [Nakamurella sp. A5-74]|uniref:DUF3000 domain-containing protein n=1 Tax=Nakamurella sp. A5-74 TaxID=3158264 RepID=A0AAU8DN99_9ACTN